MNIGICSWRTEDSTDQSKTLNNKNVQDHLRDELPLPYTAADAESFISAMLSADRDKVFHG